ncbi:GNAT family N-acetyltransferase [Frankia sp. AgKG'84/4]|uniref:GNAT family N-acetyltransferase n=1 Tax=Frankia sp. AgKG'84/4 TaxID=573490 RepID=UPI0020106A95|nr:GNAT family N-acetyltransferase [Frankia sp. AgKG'84/4]MCL9794434.1 GNAT family N-acetyltransferase [Frankia sp. AgKG'84/4]
MALVPPSAPGNLTFRVATGADAEAIVALVQSAYRGEPSRAGWTTEADLVAGQRTDTREVRALLAVADSEILLAEDPAGALVGCCQVSRRVDLPPQQEQPLSHHGLARTGEAAGGADQADADAAATTVGAYFGMFAVSPTEQGAGVGGALLAQAERHAARTWSAGWMELVVIAQRTELIDWYLRRGYRRTGQTRPFPYDDPSLGEPMRSDLYFTVLRRPLS